MQTSPKGIALIKSYESCKLTAYLCPAGVWTIGWGTTRGIHEGMRITRDEADALFLRDLRQFEATVAKLVRVPLTQGQWDALVSLVYNCGPAPLKGTLGKVLNQGRYDAVPAQFMRWVRAGGRELPGLVRRRRAETALWRDLGDVPDEDLRVGPVEAAPAKPLTASGTIKGVAVAGTGAATVMGDALSDVQTNITTASDIIATVQAFDHNLIFIGAALVIAGLAWIAYRRWADREVHL